jgi:hypothetical protein
VAAPAETTVANAPEATSAAEAPQEAAATGLRAKPQAGEQVQPAREMLDIEGNLNIVVEDVARAAASLRQLVKQSGGVLTKDVESQSERSLARFTIRIDAPHTDVLVASLGSLGQVAHRSISARDVGKEYQDSEILVQNLTVTMHRYEQLLERASNMNEILTLENELTRLRGRIEQVKGNLRWLQDRVARSTIHVELSSPHSREPAPLLAPEAKFYPGLRLTFLRDWRGQGVRQTQLGAGVSIRFSRAFSIDVDGLRLRDTGAPTNGLDALIATLGGEFYSELLGNGQRRYLNPYVGLRAGYARFLEQNELVLGGTVGIELVKLKYFTVDLDVRAQGFIGDDSHFAVQPALQIGSAF